MHRHADDILRQGQFGRVVFLVPQYTGDRRRFRDGPGLGQHLQRQQPPLPGDDDEPALRAAADRQRVQQPVRRDRRRQFVQPRVDAGFPHVALPYRQFGQGDFLHDRYAHRYFS